MSSAAHDSIVSDNMVEWEKTTDTIYVTSNGEHMFWHSHGRSYRQVINPTLSYTYLEDTTHGSERIKVVCQPQLITYQDNVFQGPTASFPFEPGEEEHLTEQIQSVQVDMQRLFQALHSENIYKFGETTNGFVKGMAVGFLEHVYSLKARLNTSIPRWYRRLPPDTTSCAFLPFTFKCSVALRDGNVHSVCLTPTLQLSEGKMVHLGVTSRYETTANLTEQAYNALFVKCNRLPDAVNTRRTGEFLEYKGPPDFFLPSRLNGSVLEFLKSGQDDFEKGLREVLAKSEWEAWTYQKQPLQFEWQAGKESFMISQVDPLTEKLTYSIPESQNRD